MRSKSWCGTFLESDIDMMSSQNKNIELSPYPIVQTSPRSQSMQRSPYTLHDNSNALEENFIATSAVSAEGPRGLVVSKTGEKRSINVDKSIFKASSTKNPFAVLIVQNVESSNLSTHNNEETMPSLPRLRKKPTDHSEETNDYLTKPKKSKHSFNRLNPKQCVMFTPRRYCDRVETRDAETQTLSVLIPPKIMNIDSINHSPQSALAMIRESISEIPILSNASKPEIGSGNLVTDERLPFQLSTLLPPSLSRTGPTRVLESTAASTQTEIYAELAVFIIAAIMLVTLLIWILSRVFELDDIIDICYYIIQTIRNCFGEPEKPKTTIELIYDFIKGLFYN